MQYLNQTCLDGNVFVKRSSASDLNTRGFRLEKFAADSFDARTTGWCQLCFKTLQECRSTCEPSPVCTDTHFYTGYGTLLKTVAPFCLSCAFPKIVGYNGTIWGPQDIQNLMGKPVAFWFDLDCLLCKSRQNGSSDKEAMQKMEKFCVQLQTFRDGQFLNQCFVEFMHRMVAGPYFEEEKVRTTRDGYVNFDGLNQPFCNLALRHVRSMPRLFFKDSGLLTPISAKQLKVQLDNVLCWYVGDNRLLSSLFILPNSALPREIIDASIANTSLSNIDHVYFDDKQTWGLVYRLATKKTVSAVDALRFMVSSHYRSLSETSKVLAREEVLRLVLKEFWKSAGGKKGHGLAKTARAKCEGVRATAVNTNPLSKNWENSLPVDALVRSTDGSKRFLAHLAFDHHQFETHMDGSSELQLNLVGTPYTIILDSGRQETFTYETYEYFLQRIGTFKTVKQILIRPAVDEVLTTVVGSLMVTNFRSPVIRSGGVWSSVLKMKSSSSETGICTGLAPDGCSPSNLDFDGDEVNTLILKHPETDPLLSHGRYFDNPDDGSVSGYSLTQAQIQGFVALFHLADDHKRLLIETVVSDMGISADPSMDHLSLVSLIFFRDEPAWRFFAYDYGGTTVVQNGRIVKCIPITSVNKPSTDNLFRSMFIYLCQLHIRRRNHPSVEVYPTTLVYEAYNRVRYVCYKVATLFSPLCIRMTDVANTQFFDKNMLLSYFRGKLENRWDDSNWSLRRIDENHVSIPNSIDKIPFSSDLERRMEASKAHSNWIKDVLDLLFATGTRPLPMLTTLGPLPKARFFPSQSLEHTCDETDLFLHGLVDHVSIGSERFSREDLDTIAKLVHAVYEAFLSREQNEPAAHVNLRTAFNAKVMKFPENLYGCPTTKTLKDLRMDVPSRNILIMQSTKAKKLDIPRTGLKMKKANADQSSAICLSGLPSNPPNRVGGTYFQHGARITRWSYVEKHTVTWSWVLDIGRRGEAFFAQCQRYPETLLYKDAMGTVPGTLTLAKKSDAPIPFYTGINAPRAVRITSESDEPRQRPDADVIATMIAHFFGERILSVLEEASIHQCLRQQPCEIPLHAVFETLARMRDISIAGADQKNITLSIARISSSQDTQDTINRIKKASTSSASSLSHATDVRRATEQWTKGIQIKSQASGVLKKTNKTKVYLPDRFTIFLSGVQLVNQDYRCKPVLFVLVTEFSEQQNSVWSIHGSAMSHFAQGRLKHEFAYELIALCYELSSEKKIVVRGDFSRLWSDDDREGEKLVKWLLLVYGKNTDEEPSQSTQKEPAEFTDDRKECSRLIKMWTKLTEATGHLVKLNPLKNVRKGCSLKECFRDGLPGEDTNFLVFSPDADAPTDVAREPSDRRTDTWYLVNYHPLEWKIFLRNLGLAVTSTGAQTPMFGLFARFVDLLEPVRGVDFAYTLREQALGLLRLAAEFRFPQIKREIQQTIRDWAQSGMVSLEQVDGVVRFQFGTRDSETKARTKQIFLAGTPQATVKYFLALDEHAMEKTRFRWTNVPPNEDFPTTAILAVDFHTDELNGRGSFLLGAYYGRVKIYASAQCSDDAATVTLWVNRDDRLYKKAEFDLDRVGDSFRCTQFARSVFTSIACRTIEACEQQALVDVICQLVRSSHLPVFHDLRIRLLKLETKDALGHRTHFVRAKERFGLLTQHIAATNDIAWCASAGGTPLALRYVQAGLNDPAQRTFCPNGILARLTNQVFMLDGSVRRDHTQVIPSLLQELPVDTSTSDDPDSGIKLVQQILRPTFGQRPLFLDATRAGAVSLECDRKPANWKFVPLEQIDSQECIQELSPIETNDVLRDMMDRYCRINISDGRPTGITPNMIIRHAKESLREGNKFILIVRPDGRMHACRFHHALLALPC